MKINLSTLIFVFVTLSVKSQTIDCNSFCVTSIYNDSVQTQVSIQMLDSGFVNYPHIAAILDQNGDTISTGSMFYFGQVGETTQDYPTSLSNTDWSSFTGTIVFVYDNDTCSLDFPCNSLNTASNLISGSYTIFPNPATSFIQLRSNELPTYLSFYSMQGQLVRKVYIESENQVITIENLPAGSYITVSKPGFMRPSLFIKH